MITTYKHGACTIYIHDPCKTDEDREQRRERLERACVRFMKEIEKRRKANENTCSM